MATKTSGVSPDKRRKYAEAFKTEALRLANESRSTQAAARQLSISPKLLDRWQQAQLVAEVGSEEVARDPEVRAQLKRAEQELDILKKALVIFGQPTRGAPLPQCPAGCPSARLAVLSGAARGARRVLCLATPPAGADGLASSRA